MPHAWNNLIVVTKEELLPWYNWNNLKTAIQRYKDKPWGVKRACNGHNGQQMLILFDSLQPQIQQALGDPRKCDHILQKYFKLDNEAVRWYQTFTFEDGSYLDTPYQEKYITNASMLKAVIALREDRITERRSKSGSLMGIGATLCSDAHSFQKALNTKFQLEHTLPENERCFATTLSKFEKEGYISLISGKHKNQNTRKVTDETLDLLNSLFAGDRIKPTATEVHRRYDAFIGGYLEVLNNETAEVYNPSEFKKLSDATVKNYMASWASKIGTYALRSGDRQTLMQQFKPYHSLDKPKYAGSIISIDDRQPPFKTPDGKRVWFYNGIDLGSEAFVCWVPGDTKEGIIMEFYRELVRNFTGWGFPLPNELEAEMSLNSSFTNTFLREGAMFQKVRIEANNARGKRIERYFRSLRYGIEKDREGWLARPFAKSESNQAGRYDVPALPFRTIVENALQDIETWNNQPHSVHTHMSRWQVFREMQHPDLKPINYSAILPYIGEKVETSCRVGIIRLQYKEFLLGIDGKVALGDRLIHLMKQVEGKQVDIWWLDDHQGAVLKACVFIGTQYICEAVAKPTYNRATIEQTASDKGNRQIMSSYVATIESFAKRQKNKIDTITILDNRPALKKDFVMPGLRQDRLTDLPTGELMQDNDDMFEQIPVASQQKSLKDRF